MTKQKGSQKKLKVTEVVTGSDGGGHSNTAQVSGTVGSSGDAVGQSRAGSVTSQAGAAGVDAVRGLEVKGSAGLSAGIRDPVLAGGEGPLPDDRCTHRKMAADQIGGDHTRSSVRSRASSISSMTEDCGSLQGEHHAEFQGLRGESPKGQSPRLMPEIQVLRETVSETFEVVGGLHEKIETAIQGAMRTAVKEMASVLSGSLHEAISEMRQEITNKQVQGQERDMSHARAEATRDSSRQKQSVPRSQYQTSSSSESECDEQTSVHYSDASAVRSVRTGRHTYHKGAKLPPFTGKETWKVWFNRFSEIAERRKWTDEEKLDELLPKLQGAAGEFVFGELDKKICSNYKQLVSELKSRFRKVETAKNFGAQFNHRSQKTNETVEAYAAELKRLYDKGYAKRDANTRKEDLLRRFLDGLIDEKASFQVEYIKDPKDIDEAVFEVVNFLDARQHSKVKDSYLDRRYKKPTRMVRPLGSDSDASSDDDQDMDSSQEVEKVARVQETRPYNKGPNSRPSQHPQGQTKARDIKSKPVKTDGTTTTVPVKDQFKAIMAQLEKLQERMTKTESAVSAQNDQARDVQQPGQRSRPLQCYGCGAMGHFARECPNKQASSGFVPRLPYSYGAKSVEISQGNQRPTAAETTQKVSGNHSSTTPVTANQSN